jgi:chromosome partitioning protein
MKSIVFFNNKGGVGKTTTIYHLAWMLSELGERVLAVDLDPQSNLTNMFLQQARMEELFLPDESKTIESRTILDAIQPISEGEPYQPVHLEKITEEIALLVGNLSLSAFEDKLSDAWLKCLGGDIFAFKVSSVFKTLIDDAAKRWEAKWVLIDVGPNLGAINRAVTIATDYVVIPVGADLFSLQGIQNLGTTLRLWQQQWTERLEKYPKPDKSLIPQGNMRAMGYLLMQYTARDSRPVKSYIRWAERIPVAYHRYVNNASTSVPMNMEADPNCLAWLKHYHSLAPMSMEAKKPMFLLKPADGAIGAHVQAVQRSYADFKQLCLTIMERAI